jgi:hypothetical protein
VNVCDLFGGEWATGEWKKHARTPMHLFIRFLARIFYLA